MVFVLTLPPNSRTGSSTTLSTLDIIVIVVLMICIYGGGILELIGWIGALIKTAQLSRWGWFVCLLVLSPFSMIAYVFAGPTTPAIQPPLLQQTQKEIS